MNYVAFDFETANESPSSPCSLGAVKVVNGIEVDSFYKLINPEQSFHPYNVDLHGITASRVKDSATYPEIMDLFIDFIEDYPIVSHSPFDRTVIKYTSNRYKYQFKEVKYFDSYLISRSIWGNKFIKFGLKPLTKKLGYEFNHHHALEDARAIIHIINALASELNKHHIFEIINSAGYKKFGVITVDGTEGFQKSQFKKLSSKLTSQEVKELKSQVDIEKLNKAHPFYKKNIVITGKFHPAFSQKDLQFRIIELGGAPQNNVVKSTHILGDGIQIAHNIKGDGLSSKARKAYQLKKDGHDIEILGKDDFINILFS